MNEFKDKIILVTGAGKGSGRALAEAFADRGARVAANDISPINLDEVVGNINKRGGIAKAFVEDVAKKVAVQAMLNQITDEWGRVDILINCANVEPRYPLLDIDEWDWHRVLDVNVTGALLMMQSAGRIMRAQNGGVIVNVATLTRQLPEPQRAAYLASRAALVLLTRFAAPEFADARVRLHAVCTGLPELHHAEIAASDIISAALALCSDEAAHLNGQIVNVNAGDRS
jgi:3-oxoacyl-[acyl-carrier protein] reductase